MYDFIYSSFVRLFEKIGTVEPRDNAATALLIAIFFHLFFVLNLVSSIFEVNLLTLVYGKNHSKYLWLPAIILIMIIVYRIYRKRSDQVLKKYSNVDLRSWKNVALLITIIVGPFIAAIWLLTK